MYTASTIFPIQQLEQLATTCTTILFFLQNITYIFPHSHTCENMHCLVVNSATADENSAGHAAAGHQSGTEERPEQDVPKAINCRSNHVHRLSSRHIHHDGNGIMIRKRLADGKLPYKRDARATQLLPGSDTTEHKELGGLEGATADYHLPSCLDLDVLCGFAAVLRWPYKDSAYGGVAFVHIQAQSCCARADSQTASSLIGNALVQVRLVRCGPLRALIHRLIEPVKSHGRGCGVVQIIDNREIKGLGSLFNAIPKRERS